MINWASLARQTNNMREWDGQAWTLTSTPEAEEVIEGLAEGETYVFAFIEDEQFYEDDDAIRGWVAEQADAWRKRVLWRSWTARNTAQHNREMIRLACEDKVFLDAFRTDGQSMRAYRKLVVDAIEEAESWLNGLESGATGWESYTVWRAKAGSDEFELLGACGGIGYDARSYGARKQTETYLREMMAEDVPKDEHFEMEGGDA